MCFCVYMCVFFLYLLLFPSRDARTSALSSECKIAQAHVTDWISFLPSNLMEEISPNPEALGVNTLRLLSSWIS